MKTFIFLSLNFLLFCNGVNSGMQSNSSVSPVVQKSDEKGLFESDEILNITLKGNVRQLLNDRTDKPAYYPFTLTYSNGASTDITLPIKIKTRGHFRRQQGNCTYPPLLLDFPKADSQTTSFFPEQSSLKLVVPCRGEDYIIHEWLVYKLYNLITPLSFRARLVKVTLEDTRNKKMP
ncbi:MAG: hypothetical protein ABI185_06995, partial [Ginsengibacter sp.]